MASGPTPQPYVDVRMRGFSSRVPWSDAVAWVDRQAIPLCDLACETVGLLEASGRVLCDDVVSNVQSPAYRKSMMDGFALRSSEVRHAAENSPISLAEVGIALPGTPFDGAAPPASVLRVMTGAPVPQAYDAVVPVEHVRVCDDAIEITAPVPAGKHIGQPGDDVERGDVVLSAGRRLRPQDVGVLSSIGVAKLSVVRRPRVAIIVTGDELLPPGSAPRDYRFPDANGPMLAALVARDGGELVSLERIADQRETLAAAMHLPCDVLLISGGSSVGQEDHAPSLLAEIGSLDIHGVAMRPGSPVGMGRIGETTAFLLPGNPVSCLCGYDFFAGRCLRQRGGLPLNWPYRRVQAKLGREVVSQAGRVDYARATLHCGVVEPLAISGSSILTSTTRADGFFIVPADASQLDSGAEVDFWEYAPRACHR
ncbi:MAG: molybdopterin molybdotransferase MoeA [Planctomycetales bacterium]|nr:molybdopterin molybdotransferase MoeA [Planctomycetales bacterium]